MTRTALLALCLLLLLPLGAAAGEAAPDTADAAGSAARTPQPGPEPEAAPAVEPAAEEGLYAGLRRFLDRYGESIAFRTYQHLYLVFFAMVIVIAIALPLGIFMARSKHKHLTDVIMSAAGMIQTVPSLALVALMMPVFILLGRESIGIEPGLTALVLYAFLPILRNTYTGIRQVDPSIIEVATGMGMTRRQILFKVQLPLALPFIMAGVRISMVWTIGVAALVTFIGAGGLGALIDRGLSNNNVEQIFAGAIPAMAMAVIFDRLLEKLEDWFTPAGIEEQGTGGAV
jgi:osmoprotectant transport system permease protein